jgi:hypothetical protein
MRDSPSELLEVRFPQAPSNAEVAQVRQRLHACRNAPQSGLEPRPFLLITLLGMPMREQIAQGLTELGIALGARTPLDDWPTAATLIYTRTDDDERLRVALAFERLWRSLSLSQQAERWDLADPADFPRLIAAKESLRSRVGTLRLRLSLPGATLRTPGQIVRLQALHVPDPDTWAAESRLLDTLRRASQP